MTVRGIEGVFLETHNWGATARFLRGLGFDLDFETDHNSGRFRKGDGPFVFAAEIPADREPGIQLVLGVADTTFRPGEGVEVAGAFEPTHYGTSEMTVRDPDGRLWSVQAPGGQ